MNSLRYESMWHIDVVCSQRGTYIHCNRWLEHLMYDLCSGRLRTETTIQLQSKKCEEANKALHLFAFHYILLRCDIIFRISALFSIIRKNGNAILLCSCKSKLYSQTARPPIKGGSMADLYWCHGLAEWGPASPQAHHLTWIFISLLVIYIVNFSFCFASSILLVSIYVSAFYHQLLCNDNIVMSRKLPFCLYLVWVYLDADLEDTHSPNTSDLL